MIENDIYLVEIFADSDIPYTLGIYDDADKATAAGAIAIIKYMTSKGCPQSKIDEEIESFLEGWDSWYCSITLLTLNETYDFHG